MIVKVEKREVAVDEVVILGKVGKVGTEQVEVGDVGKVEG